MRNIFTDKRNIESVAYDLALALATKDPAVVTPLALMLRIEYLLPECRAVAEDKFKQETAIRNDKKVFSWQL